LAVPTFLAHGKAVNIGVPPVRLWSRSATLAARVRKQLDGWPSSVIVHAIETDPGHGLLAAPQVVVPDVPSHAETAHKASVVVSSPRALRRRVRQRRQAARTARKNPGWVGLMGRPRSAEVWSFVVMDIV
jgi:hypothetical protein